MGKKPDIHLLCLSPGRNGQLVAYAYDGQLNAKGENHRVSFATEERDKTKAMTVVLEFIEALKNAWDQTYGAAATKERNEAPDGCIGQLLDDRVADLMAEYGEKNSTFCAWKREATMFGGLLGPRRLVWLPTQVDPKLMTQLCNRRASTLDPETDSVRSCFAKLRFVLNPIGFTQETLDAIQAPKRKGRGRSKKYSTEYPFYDPEIRIMWLNLPRGSDTVRGLFHAQACSTTQPVDTAMLTWKEAEEAMECVFRGRRIKTQNPFQFYMSPELFAWLKERRKQRPHDYYVFYELVFSERARRKDPDCTKRPVAKEKAHAAEVEGYRIFNDFLRNVCQLKREGIGLRSFKYYNASELFGAGANKHLIMMLTGHDKIESFLHYLTGLPKYLRRLGEVLRKHYEAAIKGEETEVFLTRAEMVDAVRKDTRQNRLEHEHWLDRRLDAMPERFLRTLANLPRGCLRVEPDGCLVIRLPRHIEAVPASPGNGFAHENDQLSLPLPDLRN